MDPVRARTYSWSDPVAIAADAQRLSGREFLEGFLKGQRHAPPIADTLDFTLVEVGDGRAVFAATPQEFHYNPIGVVHGGLAATLMDSAMGCAVQSRLPAGTAYTTLDLGVKFVRALTKETGRIRAVAETVHVGRTVATAQARVIDAADKLYATGTATCLVFPARA